MINEIQKYDKEKEVSAMRHIQVQRKHEVREPQTEHPSALIGLLARITSLEEELRVTEALFPTETMHGEIRKM